MRIHVVHGEELPHTGKISPTACLGFRVLRPNCTCCGMVFGIRRGKRNLDERSKAYKKRFREGRSYRDVPYNIPSKGHKPKYKDHYTSQKEW